MLVLIFLSIEIGCCQDLPDAPHHHKTAEFNPSTLSNAFAISGIAADAWSTQSLIGQGGFENNPVARPFVASRSGQAAISSIGAVAMISGEWLAHKRHWYGVEKWIPRIVGVIEWSCVARNLEQRRY